MTVYIGWHSANATTLLPGYPIRCVRWSEKATYTQPSVISFFLGGGGYFLSRKNEQFIICMIKKNNIA